jgi:nitrogen fixation NifU-like protein
MNTKNDKLFDFWNDHSLEFLEMAMKRDFQESVKVCDGYGKRIRDCGDTIEIFLNRKEGVLESISYDLKGCLFSHACVNTIIKLARHKAVDDAKKITKQDIIAYLKTLPEAEEHCASHAISVFNMALDNLDE